MSFIKLYSYHEKSLKVTNFNRVSQLFEKLETIVGENQLATDERMENLSANVTRILELLEGVERTGAILDHQNRLDKNDDTVATVNNAR